MYLMMKSSSSGCRNPNINNNRDLQPAVLLTPKLTSASSTTQNPELPLNHHLHLHHHQMIRGTSMSVQGRSSTGCFCIDEQPVAAAARLRRTRWTPTPEQVMALKEMYRCGLKTPTAKQIQLVTAQLRHFGRIESKNVFYWFQNHRARERQKRRRELMSMYQSTDSKQQRTFTNNTTSGDLQDKESAEGLTKSSVEVELYISTVEVEQQNNWKLPNSTGISDQESSSVLQERMMSMVDRNSSRQLVKQSASPRPNSDTTLIHRKLSDYHHCYHHDHGMVLIEPTYCRREEERRETITLELFPLKSDNLRGTKDTKLPLSRTTSTVNTTADSIADHIISVFERIKAAYN